MELSWHEIKDYLEYSYDRWTNQMHGPDDYMIAYQLDSKGNPVIDQHTKTIQTVVQFFSYDSAAGINYTVNLSKPVGQKVQIITMSNGQAFDVNKKYKVALSSYRGSSGGGYLTEGANIPLEQLSGRIIAVTDKDLRLYLSQMFKKEGTVQPPFFTPVFFCAVQLNHQGNNRLFLGDFRHAYDSLPLCM